MIRHRVVELPSYIRGLSRQDVNGDYTILINANLSDEAKRRAFLHEMGHIKNEDFLDEEEAYKIEERLAATRRSN